MGAPTFKKKQLSTQGTLRVRSLVAVDGMPLEPVVHSLGVTRLLFDCFSRKDCNLSLQAGPGPLPPYPNTAMQQRCCFVTASSNNVRPRAPHGTSHIHVTLIPLQQTSQNTTLHPMSLTPPCKIFVYIFRSRSIRSLGKKRQLHTYTRNWRSQLAREDT